MRAIKNWWYGWDGPAYKLHTVKRWVELKLGSLGLLTGNCAGCSQTTKGFDAHFGWHICDNCFSENIFYNRAQ